MALKRGDPIPDDAAPAVKEMAQAFIRNWCLKAVEKVRVKEAEAKADDAVEAALDLAELMDGKLLLVTNTPDLSPKNVVDRYKSLADIERGFRVLKSEIEIGPVFHRLPERIKAHASICFMVLILYRIMRFKLKAAKNALSPERALDSLRRIQHHRIQLNGENPVEGISTITDEQAKVFQALGVKKPAASQQLSLL